MNNHDPGQHSDELLAAMRRTNLESYSWQQRLVSRAKELGAYGWYACTRHRVPEKRFIILSRGRTGSTLLKEILHSHPDIHCDGEQLHGHVDMFDPVRYVKAFATWHNKRGYGCKIHITQFVMQRDSLRTNLERFAADGWQILYLYRRNIVRQAISTYIAINRATWYTAETNSLENYQTHIDPKHLMFLLLTSKRVAEIERSAIENIPHLPLFYEDHLLRAACHQTTADEVFKYLGFQSAPVHTRSKRMSPPDLRDVIINYDDIEGLIRRSEYAHFLDRA